MFTRLFRLLWSNRDALSAAGLYVLGYAIVVIVVILGEIDLISHPSATSGIPAYAVPSFFGSTPFESQVAKQFSPILRLALFLRVAGSAYVIAWIFVRVVTAIAARRRPVLAIVRARVTLLATVAVLAWMALFGTLRADVADRYGGVIHHRGLTLSQVYDDCDRTKNPTPSNPTCAQIAADELPAKSVPLSASVPPTRSEAEGAIAKFLLDNPPISDPLVPPGQDFARYEGLGALTTTREKDRFGVARPVVRVAGWARPFLTPMGSHGFAPQFTLGTCVLVGITSIDTSEHRGLMPFAVTYRKRCVPNELGRKVRLAGGKTANPDLKPTEARAHLISLSGRWAIDDLPPQAPGRPQAVR